MWAFSYWVSVQNIVIGINIDVNLYVFPLYLFPFWGVFMATNWLPSLIFTPCLTPWCLLGVTVLSNLQGYFCRVDLQICSCSGWQVTPFHTPDTYMWSAVISYWMPLLLRFNPCVDCVSWGANRCDLADCGTVLNVAEMLWGPKGHRHRAEVLGHLCRQFQRGSEGLTPFLPGKPISKGLVWGKVLISTPPSHSQFPLCCHPHCNPTWHSYRRPVIGVANRRMATGGDGCPCAPRGGMKGLCAARDKAAALMSGKALSNFWRVFYGAQ